MRKSLIAIVLTGFVAANLHAQSDTVGMLDFAGESARLLASEPLRLKALYPSLQEYLSFVDQSYTASLAGLSEEKRAAKADELKKSAGKDYPKFRKEYEQSCRDIADFLDDYRREGYILEVLSATGAPDPEDRSIYRMLCTLSLVHPEERQTLRLGYLAIYTPSGWRLLDGFFENPRG